MLITCLKILQFFKLDGLPFYKLKIDFLQMEERRFKGG